MRPPRRLVIRVCLNEAGVASVPLRPGERARRLTAPMVADALERLAAERGLQAHVRVSRTCAGGCSGPGPNVSVAIYPPRRPGEPEDHVAIGWRTYIGALPDLRHLRQIIDENV